jgi:NAD(P)-dependent dehydrogenase (short-subunit alcohol dehydrogenase family)
MKLKDKVALVTGSSKGLGRAVALTFAREGADVVVNGRDVPAMEEVCRQIEELERKALMVPADVREAGQVREMVDQTLAAFGRIDILINNAGGALFTPVAMDQLEEEHWDLVVDTNLKGAFLCAKEVLPPMKAQGYGRIVNVSSKAGRTYGTIAGAHYVSAKAGVVGLTRQLAWETGRFGITVNAVAPGLFLSTDRIENLWESRPKEIKDQLMKEIALGRLGEVDELANVVLFLASDDASYVTGVVVDVNGGRFMG